MGQSKGHHARAHGGDREGAARTLKRRRVSPNASARVGDEQIAPAPTSGSLGDTVRLRLGSQNAGHVDHGDAGGLHVAAPGAPAPHPNPHKSDLCLERRRPGDSSAAVLRVGGYEWVVRRRCVHGSAAAGGESPGDTVHRSAPQVEHVHNGDGLHAERRRFLPQRAVPGACIPRRAAPDFEVAEPATYEYYLQRRRPGDPSRAVFRVCGVEWVVRRRRCIRAAAAGGSPVVLPQAGPYATCELGATNPFLELPAINGIRPQLPHAGGSDIFLALGRTKGAPSLFKRAGCLANWNYWFPSYLFSWAVWSNSVELSERLLPKEWTWEWIAYPPVYQCLGRDGMTGEGSCAICSLVMCIHARYRLQYERRHGVGSFPFKVAMDVRYLKAACRRANIWRPAKMGTTPARVLKLLDSHPDIGIKTELFNGVPGPTLRPSSWGEFYSSFTLSSTVRTGLNHSEMARMIRLGGPIVGALHAGPSYRSAVHPLLSYKGADATDWEPNHATLCVGYYISDKDEMEIKVLDNQDSKGPLLWVRYEWFSYFTVVEFEEEESRVQAIFRHIRRVASNTARAIASKARLIASKLWGWF